MANTKSAAKRTRQSIQRTADNRRVSTGVKSQIKKTRSTIAGGDQESTKRELRSASASVDKAAKTGRMHRNAANRIKSRLAKAAAKTAA